MKKIILCALVLIVIAIGTIINVNLNKVSNNGDLVLANVEATADLESWWNRPDWDCDPLSCYYFGIFSYFAEQPVYIGSGEGTVAHAWLCTGCAEVDYGV